MFVCGNRMSDHGNDRNDTQLVAGFAFRVDRGSLCDNPRDNPRDNTGN